MATDYRKLYNKANKLLENVTPLKGDCGTVCGANCCKGDSETGMLLFPHEETEFNVIEKNGRKLVVCNGTCNRTKRPLACRLFPLFPFVDENGKIDVCLDYRGNGICPLIEHCDEVVFDSRFLRRMKKVGKMLYSDSEIAEFMNSCVDEIKEEQQLKEMFE